MSKSRNIVVIDSEESIRDLLREYFETLGYRVHVTSSMGEAYDFVASGNVSAVLVDDAMVSGDDMASMNRLKGACPGIRIIIISGYPTLQGVIKAMRHGVFDIVIKPFRLDEMKGIVRRALKPSREKILLKKQRARIKALENLLAENGIPAEVEACHKV